MADSILQMIRTLSIAFALLLPQGADLDKVLEKAEALLEQAKAGYEEARSKSAAPIFVEAGFKLEEARIKYLAILEVGSPEQQKTAADRTRAVNQLAKLIHDGKVVVSGAGGGFKPEAPVQPPENPRGPPPPAKPPAAGPRPMDRG